MNTLTDTSPPIQTHETRLAPIERGVFSEEQEIEHALGSHVSHLVEKDAVLVEDLFLADQEHHNLMRVTDRDKLSKLPLTNLDSRDSFDGVTRAVNKVDRAYAKVSSNKRDIITELDAAREKIITRHKVDDSDEGKIRIKDLPPFLAHQYTHHMGLNAVDPSLDVTDWITQNTVEGGVRLYHFLQYNTDRYEKLQSDPQLIEALNEVKQNWLKGVKQGIEQGWLYPSASHAQDRMRLLTTVFADYYDLDAEDTAGYSLPGEFYIVLGSSPQQIASTGTHEMNHALLGVLEYEVIREAVTEHIAQVIDGSRDIDDISSPGSPTIANNVNTTPQDHFYRRERDLLAGIIKASDGKLTVSDFTRAYSDSSLGWGIHDQTKLDQKIDDAFGVDNAVFKILTCLIKVHDYYSFVGNVHHYEQAYTEVINTLLTNPKVIFDLNFEPELEPELEQVQ